MAKGDKKQGEKSDAGDDREAPSSTWVCSACEQENEAVDGLCCACEEPRPDQAAEGDDRFQGYKVGVIISVESVPKKDKLSMCKVDVGDSEELQVVTNAPVVVPGMRVIVATVGAVVRGETGEDEVVKKGAVGGVMSAGMLCNAPMLGWKGGDSRAAATLPDGFAVGSRPPETRPRKD